MLSRTKIIGNASVFQLAVTGSPMLVEESLKALDPNAAAQSSGVGSNDLVGQVNQYLPLGTRSVRNNGGSVLVKSRVRLVINHPYTLISDGLLDSSSPIAAYLLECSGERELEIECYSEVPSKMVAEHVVIVDGAATIYESRPWRDRQPDGRYNAWGGFKMLFESRPQSELEDVVEEEALEESSGVVQAATSKNDAADVSEPVRKALEFAKKAQERKVAEGKLDSNAVVSPSVNTIQPKTRASGTRQTLEPPAPWQTHRDDFLAVSRTAEVEVLEKSFEHQASLLREVVSPVEYNDTFVRSVSLPGSKDLVGGSAYAKHMRKVHLNYTGQNVRNYRVRERIIKPLFDVVCFQAADKRAAFLHNVSDLGDIPFQGSGGFGLAVIPSNQKRADANELFAKIALCQFLDVAPQCLECIVVAKASKIDLKRLQEIEDAGIPIVFDFSGRTSPTKDKRDPLENMFTISGRRELVFNGRLNEEQAASFGELLDKESRTRMLQALTEAALEGASGYYQAGWSEDIIDTLTFGHEKITHVEGNGDEAAPVSPARTSRRSGFVRSSRPWQFAFAEFPPESMPTLDSANAIKRMHDVGVIWCTMLKDYGLRLYVERSYSSRSNSAEKPFVLNKSNLQEIGKFLGIDAMIDSLYNGVPLDYII